ncbi:hypothetical protein [Hymenobacter swuensis]|uniref:PepSY domain-containing protein n=1 Tax=Hymenobacter swuensis DY53 TaxID=1227739 RepID=W8EW61_9BACT|nr:hypothetical protein [Hymenobacter swuensis]AHJ96788.1 hypothetical protein Hsw_1193 [Hymenobacter swuensis DY53]
MKNTFLLGFLLLAAACTSPQQTTTAETQTTTQEPVGAAAVSETQAATIATRYFRSQPDSAVYQLNTLQVMEAGPHWQVLVKRSDRVGRMPDNSAIEVDKQTGAVSTVMVK